MDQSRILKVAIFIKELAKCINIYCLSVISRKEDRLAAIHLYKILESSSKDSVVNNKDTVSFFRQRSARCLKTEDTFSSKNKSLCLGIKKFTYPYTEFLIIFNERQIQIRICAWNTSCFQYVMCYFCRSRRHDFIHI